MIEMKTAELTGPALDWVLDGVTNMPLPRFSTDWAQGGPLLEEYPWALPYKTTMAWRHLGEFEACTESGKSCHGGSPLIAACRVIVVAKLGGTVQVPAGVVT